MAESKAEKIELWDDDDDEVESKSAKGSEVTYVQGPPVEDNRQAQAPQAKEESPVGKEVRQARRPRAELTNVAMLLPIAQNGGVVPPQMPIPRMMRRVVPINIPQFCGENIPYVVQNILDGSIGDILHFTITFLMELSIHRAPALRDAPSSFKESIRKTYDESVKLLSSYQDQWFKNRSNRPLGPTQSIPIGDAIERGSQPRRFRKVQRARGSPRFPAQSTATRPPAPTLSPTAPSAASSAAPPASK